MNTAKDTYILDPLIHTSEKIMELLREGKHPLCPRCKAPLIVALSPEEAKRQKVNPGVRCPVNPRHFESTAYFRGP
jgi:hypothetical protein